MSDLDPQQVASRATGHFHPCFPANRPVSRPVFPSKGKIDGQQGDPLEMLIFNLTIHHLWVRVLAKFQEARAIAYADDGYIKVKLSIVLLKDYT